MHNLDRALQEFALPPVTLESASYEFDEEDEGDFQEEGDYEREGDSEEERDFESGAGMAGEGDYETVFDEVEQMEQAAALLEVQDEEELDHFLGGLVGKVAGKLGSAIPSHLRKALALALKNVARSALPVAGGALGNLLVPGLGGAAGGQIAANAGKMFGLELGGMTQEDQQFEIARRLVGLGTEAARAAAQGALTGSRSPVQMAKDLVIRAAQTHAPGLASAALDSGGATSPSAPSPYGSGQRSGRWIRRGRRVILYGL